MKNDTKDPRIVELEAKVERLGNALIEIRDLSKANAQAWRGHPIMDFITEVYTVATTALDNEAAQS